MDFGCAEFSQKIINGTHEIQSKGAKKNKKTAGNAGKNNQRKWEIKNLRGELYEISTTFVNNLMRRLDHRAQK